MEFILTATGTTDSQSPLIEPTAQQLSALQRWWQNIDWEHFISIIIKKTLTLLLIIVLFAILSKGIKFLLRRTFDSYRNKKVNTVRLNTLEALITNVTKYTLGFLFIYAILSTIGIPVGSLLAGAGIAGLAVGLGAQGFMSDIINGIFIITEQQIDVGDYIKLSNLTIEGTVVNVGIRTLKLQSGDGTIHFIPNRNIITISNTSRADMRVLVDVRIIPSEGIEAIEKIVSQVNHTIAENYVQDIQTQPTIFGIVDLGNSNFAIRTTFYVTNGQQASISEELLALTIEELTKAGFSIPNSPIIANS